MSALSPAELSVVELAARGTSTAAIARARRTSVATVTNQLGAVYRKLGLSGRRQLAALRMTSPSEGLRETTASLSPREREVWGRAARGDANKVIALDLGLSLSSAATYLARARRKLVSSTLER